MLVLLLHNVVMGTRFPDVNSKRGGGIWVTPTGNEFHVSSCRCCLFKNERNMNFGSPQLRCLSTVMAHNRNKEPLRRLNTTQSVPMSHERGANPQAPTRRWELTPAMRPQSLPVQASAAALPSNLPAIRWRAFRAALCACARPPCHRDRTRATLRSEVQCM